MFAFLFGGGDTLSEALPADGWRLIRIEGTRPEAVRQPRHASISRSWVKS
jgi:hypothetical protein